MHGYTMLVPMEQRLFSKSSKVINTQAQALAHMWLHIAGTNELKSDQQTKQGAQRPSCFCEI